MATTDPSAPRLSPLHDPEFDTPGDSRWLLDVFTHWQLFKLLLRKGTSTRYYGSVLGWLWSYIRPFLQFCMYFFVIGMVLGVNRGIELFPLYLFSGLIIINLFREAFRSATGSLTENSGLIKKIYLPRELFPVASVTTSVIHFLPQVLVLLVIALIMGWQFSFISVLLVALAVVIVFCFALGMGLFFGAINVSLRDARSMVDVFLMFAMWSSPVLYSWEMIHEIVPTWLYNIYMVNPVTVGVELMHAAFWIDMVDHGTLPDNLSVFVLAGSALALGTLLVGQLMFRRLEADFAQHL